MRDLNQKLRDASDHGHLETVQYLLEQGAEINGYNQYRSTALMYAAYEGHIDVVQLLLQRGADIHARDYYNNTALMYAVLRLHRNIINIILNLGGDINICNPDGHSALTWVLQFNQRDLAKLLIIHGAKFEGLHIPRLPETGDSEFSNHIAQGEIEAAEVLYNEHPVLLDQPNLFGQTPVMRAVICGQLGAVNWLIDHGADLDVQSEDGFTALYFAARAFLSHRHENEALQAPYRAMLEVIMQHSRNIDEHTDVLIEQDRTNILHDLINPGGYVLK